MNSPRGSLYQIQEIVFLLGDGLEEGEEDQFLALGDGVKRARV